jgi:hypothetical protein
VRKESEEMSDFYEDDGDDGEGGYTEIVVVDLDPLHQELVEIRALLERISYNFEQHTESRYNDVRQKECV